MSQYKKKEIKAYHHYPHCKLSSPRDKVEIGPLTLKLLDENQLKIVLWQFLASQQHFRVKQVCKNQQVFKKRSQTQWGNMERKAIKIVHTDGASSWRDGFEQKMLGMDMFQLNPSTLNRVPNMEDWHSQIKLDYTNCPQQTSLLSLQFLLCSVQHPEGTEYFHWRVLEFLHFPCERESNHEKREVVLWSINSKQFHYGLKGMSLKGLSNEELFWLGLGTRAE